MTAMADIVVTEFIDLGPIELLKQKYSVHLDSELWNKRAELEALVADAVGLIVRNRTRVDAALLDKAGRRQRPVEADYVGFRIPNEFVVGYGLDYAQDYRSLPDICVLD